MNTYFARVLQIFTIFRLKAVAEILAADDVVGAEVLEALRCLEADERKAARLELPEVLHDLGRGVHLQLDDSTEKGILPPDPLFAALVLQNLNQIFLKSSRNVCTLNSINRRGFLATPDKIP